MYVMHINFFIFILKSKSKKIKAMWKNVGGVSDDVIFNEKPKKSS